MQSCLKNSFPRVLRGPPIKWEEHVLQGTRTSIFIYTNRCSREVIPSYKGIESILEDKIIIQDDFDKWKKWFENRMQLYKYSCKAGTYNCTIRRWEQLSRQQFCRERYGATVNHRLNESTILGWCKNDKHHILLNKWEYYRLERWSNFTDLPCTGPLDLDLSTESMQNWPQKKYRGEEGNPTEKTKHRVQKSLTY